MLTGNESGMEYKLAAPCTALIILPHKSSSMYSPHSIHLSAVQTSLYSLTLPTASFAIEMPFNHKVMAPSQVVDGLLVQSLSLSEGLVAVQAVPSVCLWIFAISVTAAWKIMRSDEPDLHSLLGQNWNGSIKRY